MRAIYTICFTFFFIGIETVPDFTETYISSVKQNLNPYLDAGKTVVTNVFNTHENMNQIFGPNRIDEFEVNYSNPDNVAPPEELQRIHEHTERKLGKSSSFTTISQVRRCY